MRSKKRKDWELVPFTIFWLQSNYCMQIRFAMHWHTGIHPILILFMSFILSLVHSFDHKREAKKESPFSLISPQWYGKWEDGEQFSTDADEEARAGERVCGLMETDGCWSTECREGDHHVHSSMMKGQRRGRDEEREREWVARDRACGEHRVTSRSHSPFISFDAHSCCKEQSIRSHSDLFYAMPLVRIPRLSSCAPLLAIFWP